MSTFLEEIYSSNCTCFLRELPHTSQTQQAFVLGIRFAFTLFLSITDQEAL